MESLPPTAKPSCGGVSQEHPVSSKMAGTPLAAASSHHSPQLHQCQMVKTFLARGCSWSKNNDSTVAPVCEAALVRSS